MREDIILRLSDIRLNNKLVTYTFIACVADVSTSTVRNWFNGTSVPSPKAVKNLEGLLTYYGKANLH